VPLAGLCRVSRHIANRGVAVSAHQAVSQKTRKKSVSKTVKKTAAKKSPTVSRSATKGRPRASVKDTRTAEVAGAKVAAAKPVAVKRVVIKPAPAKSSKNKRSAMPNKTAKTSAKAVESKAVESKTLDSKTADAKVVESKTSAVKPVAAKVAEKAAPKAAVKPTAKTAAVAAKPAAAPRVEEPKKVLTQRQGFKTGEFVVYPAHGVGQILAIEEQEIAGAKLELFVINFMKDKMTLRVPTAKVANVGMRKLSEPALVKRALETLKGRARIKRTMWSRRAQEYEAKINSGDIVAIAEVVRDLFRSDSQPEQSYSERQLYEAALDRLSREIAVVQHVTETEAVKEIEGQLAKSPRRGAKAEAGAEAGADEADADGDDVAAADEAA
jgi:CarD family transcriptional regulator